MNNKHSLFACFLFISINAHGQFNTIWQKKEVKEPTPTLATTSNKLQDEEDSTPIINDVLYSQRRDILAKRRFLSLPIDTLIVTSKFGVRKDPFSGEMKEHKGIDIRANNNYVYSVMPGKIVKTGKSKTLGNFVEINHGDYTTIYGHLYCVLVNAKQAIDAGQPIGITGSTGRSTAEHLHFSVKYKNKLVNPMPIINYISEVMQKARIQLAEGITQGFSKR